MAVKLNHASQKWVQKVFLIAKYPNFKIRIPDSNIVVPSGNMNQAIIPNMMWWTLNENFQQTCQIFNWHWHVC